VGVVLVLQDWVGAMVDDRHDRKGYDCSDTSLSPKARRMFCREQDGDRGGRDASRSATQQQQPQTTTPTTSWSKPVDPMTVTVPATTIDDWLNPIPRCDSLQPEFDDMDQECRNMTTEPPTIRYRDMVFERLVTQSWEDTRHKINTEKKVGGVNLNPLNVDLLAGTNGRPVLDISESGTAYTANLQMWNIQVHGLAEIYLGEVLVSRDQNLYDLDMMIQFRFDSLAVNGTYNIDGSWGGFFGSSFSSDGDRAFSVQITNATFTPRVAIDTSNEESPCGKNGDVLITDIEFPFSYDDISIVFNNLGHGYNQLINTISIFILRTQEDTLTQFVKSSIKNYVNSLIC